MNRRGLALLLTHGLAAVAGTHRDDAFPTAATNEGLVGPVVAAPAADTSPTVPYGPLRPVDFFQQIPPPPAPKTTARDLRAAPDGPRNRSERRAELRRRGRR